MSSIYPASASMSWLHSTARMRQQVCPCSHCSKVVLRMSSEGFCRALQGRMPEHSTRHRQPRDCGSSAEPGPFPCSGLHEPAAEIPPSGGPSASPAVSRRHPLTSAGYTCICPGLFSGERCELGDSPCESKPCLHGGTCVLSGSGYSCHCPEWYLGDR